MLGAQAAIAWQLPIKFEPAFDGKVHVCARFLVGLVGAALQVARVFGGECELHVFQIQFAHSVLDAAWVEAEQVVSAHIKITALAYLMTHLGALGRRGNVNPIALKCRRYGLRWDGFGAGVSGDKQQDSGGGQALHGCSPIMGGVGFISGL